MILKKKRHLDPIFACCAFHQRLMHNLRGILLKYNLLFISLKTKSSRYSLLDKIMGMVNKLIDWLLEKIMGLKPSIFNLNYNFYILFCVNLNYNMNFIITYSQIKCMRNRNNLSYYPMDLSPKVELRNLYSLFVYHSITNFYK